MSLDTSIPLQIKTPEFNPLQQALGVAQYRYMNANSNQLQQKIAASQAIGQAIQRNTRLDGSVDLQGVQREVASDPNAAYGLQEATGANLAQQGQQLGNQGAQISNQGAGLQLQAAQQSHLTQQIGTLLNKSDLNRDDVVDMATTSAKAYGLPDNIVQQSIANIPSDPTQLRSFLYSKLAALGSPTSQAEAMTPGGGTIDTGPKFGIVNMRPAAGPIGAPVAIYDKGLSPEASTAPTQIGTAGDGAPIYGTRSQFIDLANNGGVKGSSQYQSNASANAADYEKGLTQRALAANNSTHYMNEAQDLMQGVSTGGGASTWKALAERAQAIGVPQSIVDQIAGGNLGDKQALSKVLMQGAIQQMQSSFSGTGAAANVDAFLKNNPNIDVDPRGMQKMIGFINGMNSVTGKEQQAYRQFVNGGGNPIDFPAKWNTSTTMRAFTGQIQPVKTGTYNGRKVIQYSDGSVDYQ
ncbi:hypothetical protein KDW60_30155 [Burkholderia cenocepacia]|uniref:hypothetical protein n=1 Tax=Burkholderia cenocepacia TaxID=95486 RepID=UPI001B906E31|nr:hypothetical protein [Burkholderia cenocepacia]MBR7940994.1 hypothetical protein [Burkholderia cenocepacia]MBR8479196.1 hypothetical protein [Burkholderia cenocepacia]